MFRWKCDLSRPPVDKISHKHFGFGELVLFFAKSTSTSASPLQLRQINFNFAISTSTSPNQLGLAFNFAKMTPTLQVISLNPMGLTDVLAQEPAYVDTLLKRSRLFQSLPDRITAWAL